MALALDQRLFALLRAIEVDAKECISQFLEPTIGLNEILKNFEPKIQKRKKDRDSPACTSNTIDTTTR